MYCQFLFVTRTTLYSTLHWCDVILIWSITNGHQNKDSLIIMDAITTFSFGLYLLFAFIALICEYIDSALVMMIAFNIDKKFLIPAVLVSETVTGLGSALLHHYVGNANFNIRKKNNSSEFNKTNDILKRYNSPSGIIKENGYNQNFFYRSLITRAKDFLNNFKVSDDFKVSIILGFFGIIGGISAAFLSLRLSQTFVKIYIGALVFLVGLFVLIGFKWKFTWVKISIIGLVAAFNKGLSGGGYGPLISSGQIVVNRNPRQAVASTSLAEALVCISSLVVYFSYPEITFNFGFLFLLLSLFIGAILSAPLAVLTVKNIPLKKMQPIVGLVTMLLGIFTLVKVFI
ncbi:MAG: sulfite exporter TauE/SafE family protein [Candidatus Heimdallarchaeaceae archaeon]